MTRFEALLESHLAGAPDEEREFAGQVAVDENRRVFEAHRRTAGMLAEMSRPPLPPPLSPKKCWRVCPSTELRRGRRCGTSSGRRELCAGTSARLSR